MTKQEIQTLAANLLVLNQPLRSSQLLTLVTQLINSLPDNAYSSLVLDVTPTTPVNPGTVLDLRLRYVLTADGQASNLPAPVAGLQLTILNTSNEYSLTLPFTTPFVVLIVVLQLWLLTATMNAYLGGDSGIVAPAALASLACLGLNTGLLWYLFGLDR